MQVPPHEQVCPRSSCTFAHDESQLRGKPDLTGTKICSSCHRTPVQYGSRCTHAHALAESSAARLQLAGAQTHRTGWEHVQHPAKGIYNFHFSGRRGGRRQPSIRSCSWTYLNEQHAAVEGDLIVCVVPRDAETTCGARVTMIDIFARIFSGHPAADEHSGNPCRACSTSGSPTGS